MRKAIVIVLMCLLAACSKNELPADEVAGRTAKLFYDCLVEGRHSDFIDGFYQPDSIPGSYREQLIMAAKMVTAEQKSERGGLKEVKLVRCTADTASHTAQAFLMLCFADSTNEEIVVPMVEHDGVWMMR